MANYNKAVHKMLQIEGFRSDHPSDPGGDTAYGISQNYWPEYWEDGVPDRETADRFYRIEFWEPLTLDQIHDQRIAYELFEQAVNLGKPRAVRFAQFCHNSVARGNDIVVDGRMGPQTRGALNRLSWDDTQRWIKAMNGMQFCYYLFRTGLMDDAESFFRTSIDEDSEAFFRGWLKRVEF